MPNFKLGSRGSQVMQIQATLKKIGYDPGPIDGIYGIQTEQAVRNFQRNNGLIQDGIIGPDTYRVLHSFILGYDNYIIKPGDTLYGISRKYGTQVYKIITANPLIEPLGLIPGNTIKVPYSTDVVDTNIYYTYDVLETDLMGLKGRYPFITVGSAGESVLGRQLHYVRLGVGGNQVSYNGSHHALEWITTPLLMKFIENFARAYSEGENIRGYNIGDIWSRSSIYIVPMVNPDGVDLVLNGLARDNPYYYELIRWNRGSADFSRDWEANNRGVDLNHNYNANWQLSKESEPSYGVYGPGPTRYSGPYAESEPETRTMVNFTNNHDFRLVLAYHSQGQVIYWQYNALTPPESRRIAELFSEVSGYRLEETTGIASYSGYKDWFIQDHGKPGFTIEVGRGINPLPINQFDQIYNENEELLLLASVI
ncbi:M14 family metallopeptidase [Clostridium sp. MT-14]|uniref:M14 family metallopeptidase n=1 Tax=Clostridium aromativorans TaxID=2836848 RepID=A0ABS8N4S4_9CLOT|nr:MULTISPECIES: M14 family metallopeptidase [Clostridium]KAA8676567.1 LysM peptidoglycan-binding domain-containing protein [Clostridium sp. HV4-5-A1G]MCC9294080.1 M14 family metallopeptidase [Clostridium aromativorans]CAB1239541.1 Gamma-D-glutamyl-L-diamino acid endopeptidase 1 [Clostridiaceae bacterium BL-3]